MAEVLAYEGIVTIIVSIAVFFSISFFAIRWSLKAVEQGQERIVGEVVKALAAIQETLKEHRQHDREEHRDLQSAMSEDRKQVFSDHQEMVKLLAEQNKILVRLQAKLEERLRNG